VPKTGQEFGTESTLTFCPVCNQKVVTHVDIKPSKVAQTCAMIICLLGGFFGCCLVPLFIPGLNDAIHSCPRCGTIVGKNTKDTPWINTVCPQVACFHRSES
ncbi:unnamed protein product, partial [Hymenolepis diminuta]